jgi:uncharacterized membrane protein YqjE
VAKTSPLDAVRRLSAATVNLLLARAEFATLELAQARAQLIRWVALALVGMALALLALVVGSVLLVIVLWPRYEWATLVVLTLVYAIAAVLVLRRLMREVASAPPVLSETLHELSNDRDVFVGRRTDSADDQELVK